jgi:hypothetical protein
LLSYKAAYSFYHVPDNRGIEFLIKNCLVLAKKLECDFFSALDNFSNQQVFAPLLFFPDKDNQVLYHLFNIKCEMLKSHEIGTVFW